MPMRLSGLMSGMDTESIIAQLVETRKAKVTKAVKAQKTIKYKQDAWKDMNKQILNLYNKSLEKMRFQSSFVKKKTKVSNSSVVSVITGENAMNSVQSLKVENLAKTCYLTSGELALAKDASCTEITGSTKLGDLGMAANENGNLNIKIGNETAYISVTADTTIDSFIGSLRGIGVNANFDQASGRIFVAAKSSGAKHDITIEASNIAGLEALNALKLNEGTATISDTNKNASIEARVKDRLGKLQNYADTLAKRDEINDLVKKYKTEINAALAPSAANKLQSVGDDFDYGKLDEQEKAELQTAIEKAIKAAVKEDGEDAPIAKDLIDLTGDLKSFDKSLADAQKYEAYIEYDNGSPKWSADAEAEIRAMATQEAEDVLNSNVKNIANKQKGEDAHIILNGVDYTSDKNTFDINGLTLTVSATTGKDEMVSITTEDDTDGVYDMIKDFLKEYNALINQMDKMYNADSGKGYEPLTDEEKESMSDSAIEEWEDKIKESILRRDMTLGNFADELKTIMLEGVVVNGKKMYLSNFGINTLSYFSAPENEKSAYHIDGDPDDEKTSGNPDKLKSMIANDPDTVVSFFTTLSKKMYDKMFDLMKSKEGVSSSMTAYEDKRMKDEYDDYTVKIKELEKKLADYEDKWYAKFAAMETALAKMQNNASAVTSLLGGG